MRFLYGNLTKKLLTLFLLLAILPLIVVGYVAFDLGRQSIISNVKAHLESVAILKESAVRDWVTHLEHVVSWAATSPSVENAAGTLAVHTEADPEYTAAHDFLVAEFERLAALGHISPVYLLDGDTGQIIAASDPGWEGQFKEAEQWFTEGTNDIYVSDIFYSLALEQPTMVIAAPVMDAGGQLLGVLAGNGNLEALNRIMLERSGLGETGETFPVNKSNLLLTNTVFAPDGAFKKWIFGEGAVRALKGETGVDLFMDYRDQPVIGAYRWMEDRKLALIVKQNQAEAFAPIVTLRNTVLGIGVGVALAVAFLGLVFARTITRPVQQLAVGAGEIGRGNLDHRIETDAQDELGRLSVAFNRMAQDLQSVTASRDELDREITERKQAEDALRIAGEKLRLALSAADEGIWEWDLETNDLYLDDVALAMVGYSREDITGPLAKGNGWADQIHPDDRSATLRRFEQYASGEIDSYAVEFRLRHKDGGYVWISSIGSITERTPTGEARVIIGIRQDITERRKAQEKLEELVEARTGELRETQEQLVRQEKLAVLGQLAGGVGHELRNPLGAIKNAVYYLNMVLNDPDEDIREMLGVLDKEADAAEKIIAGLFDFSRTRPPALRDLDINDIVRETLSRIPLPDAPHVEVTLELDENLPAALADPDQMVQVFVNIISNGIQAMPGGGRLAVRSECKNDSGERPEWVAVSVTDSGAGIPEDKLNKIWEPLFTTKAKGIGLGLAVVKALVEGNGGTIDVESREGEGSTFTVKLPTGRTERTE